MKPKLVIISSSYPYGTSETFLENEVNFISNYFSIHVIPVKRKNKTDIARDVPLGVSYTNPVIGENYFIRLFKGIFNRTPIIPYLIDFVNLLVFAKSIKSVKLWLNRFVTSRILFSSNQFKNCLKDSSNNLIYFYWMKYPFNIIDWDNKMVYCRLHGGELEQERNNYFIPMLYNVVINRKDVKYLPISHHSSNMLTQIKPVKKEINRLGVYDKGYNPTDDQDRIVVVSCSNLIALKRVNLIVEALRCIELKVEWIHFGDGPLMKSIEALVNGLPPNIIVKLKGRVPNKDVLEFYKSNHVDLFINVSLTEGVPVSIMEALSFGIPCFATDVGGTSEIVDSDVGWLVNRDFDIIELVDFINSIKRNEMNTIRLNARKRWNKLCNAKKNYKDLVLLLYEGVHENVNKSSVGEL